MLPRELQNECLKTALESAKDASSAMMSLIQKMKSATTQRPLVEEFLSQYKVQPSAAWELRSLPEEEQDWVMEEGLDKARDATKMLMYRCTLAKKGNKGKCRGKM